MYSIPGETNCICTVLATIRKWKIGQGRGACFIKIISANFKFRIKVCLGERICRRLVDEVRSTTEARCPIEFSTIGLPDGAMADERLLRHILLNLLSNAVKYSTPGQPVGFRATGADGNITFTVRDQGIGIPEADMPGLFEAFRRGSNVGQTPGTGLGLVIVKQSVELHRGRIDVASHPGAGTTFTVHIPLSPN